MIAERIFTLLAAALWLYGLYLALTRTRSPTAKGVAVLALAGLFLATGGTEISVGPGTQSYPFRLEKSRPLPALKRVTVTATNAEVAIRPGKANLVLTMLAKSQSALARMRPVIRVGDDGLTIQDDRQPKGTVYRIELALPEPVAAKIALTNGVLKAEDRLASLTFSAANGEARLSDFRPTGPTRLTFTNGTVRLGGFAPSAPTEVTLTNGEVRVRAAKPLRVEARITNGAIRLPDGTRAAAGGARATYGPAGAPPLVVHILNGELDYQEVAP